MPNDMYICTYSIAAGLSAFISRWAETLSSPYLAFYSGTPRAFSLVSLTGPDPSPILRADAPGGAAR